MLRDLFKPISWFRRDRGGGMDAGSARGVEQGPSAPTEKVTRASGEQDSALHAYSKRMLPPFSGQLQIVECGDARALSMDGENWEIQFRFALDTGSSRPDTNTAREKYTAVASITPAGLQRLSLHPVFDTEVVARTIERLSAWIPDSRLPYPAVDRFEYWLLDRSEQKPLALLRSCAGSEDFGKPMVRPVWAAMPASQMPIEDERDATEDYVPPVNARLESLVAQRAGPSPRAAWFDRAETTDIEFPTFLIREDWAQEEHSRLCRLYLDRLAPRLLMLQGLSFEDRQRLERAARANALEVDRFHRLYPEVLDQKMLNALCVEARIRRSAQPL